MAVHHHHRLHYDHFHFLSLVQSFILTLSLGSLATPFYYRPFLYLRV